MERSDRERIENAAQGTDRGSRTGARRPIPRHHQRWLVEAGFAVRREDGRLLPTTSGHEIGAALFGYDR